MQIVVLGQKDGTAQHKVYSFPAMHDLPSCLSAAGMEAEAEGFKNIICLTEAQAAGLFTRVANALHSSGYAVELDVALRDVEKERHGVGVKVQCSDDSVAMSFDGYCGYFASENEPQVVAKIVGGELFVSVFSDNSVRRETNCISMDAARKERCHLV